MTTDPGPSLADLEADPHPHLARLRSTGPVSWIPALGGWLVTDRATRYLGACHGGTRRLCAA